MKEAGRGTEDLHNMDSCLISPLVPQHPPYLVLACANTTTKSTRRGGEWNTIRKRFNFQCRIEWILMELQETPKWFVTLPCHFRTHKSNWPQEKLGTLAVGLGLLDYIKFWRILVIDQDTGNCLKWSFDKESSCNTSIGVFLLISASKNIWCQAINSLSFNWRGPGPRFVLSLPGRLDSAGEAGTAIWAAISGQMAPDTKIFRQICIVRMYWWRCTRQDMHC